MLVREAGRPGGPDCCAIAVMAKASTPGLTKTRLSPPLTPGQAADLNTVFLRDIAGNITLAAQRAAIACYMAYGPKGSAPFFAAQLPQDIGLFEAWLPNFGDCLRLAIHTLLELGYGSACVLNSDSPTLPTAILADAARALARPGERIVLGPATDGGYYLLGMQTMHHRLFEDIDWSTPRVLRQTQERAAEIGLDVVLLPVWYDVDDAASLHRLVRETLLGIEFAPGAGAYPAPFTTAILRSHRRDGTLPNCGEFALDCSVAEECPPARKAGATP